MQGLDLQRGRRRFRAGLESLEERQCLSVTVTSIVNDGGTRLRIIGDAAANVIHVLDHGDGRVDVTNGAGRLLGSADNVKAIRAELKGGADDFQYTLANPLTVKRLIEVDLGAGADTANFDLAAGVNGAKLEIDVQGAAGADTITTTVGDLVAGQALLTFDGGAGADTISIVASGISIDAESRLRSKIFGGDGKDTLSSAIDGEIFGILNTRLDGGAGVDQLVSNVLAQAGSTGILRAFASGRGGVDEVTLNVFDETIEEETSLLGELTAKLVDKPGKDTLTYTDNVTVVTNPVEV